jgi:hypothetical protein
MTPARQAFSSYPDGISMLEASKMLGQTCSGVHGLAAIQRKIPAQFT